MQRLGPEIARTERGATDQLLRMFVGVTTARLARVWHVSHWRHTQQVDRLRWARVVACQFVSLSQTRARYNEPDHCVCHE